jgi:hypothetical protein
MALWKVVLGIIDFLFYVHDTGHHGREGMSTKIAQENLEIGTFQ